MNNALSAKYLLARLAEFRSQVAEMVAREERGMREGEKRRDLAARHARAALAEGETEETQQRQALAARHAEELAGWDQRKRARAQRLQKSEKETRRRAKQRLEQQDGRVVFGFQKGTLESERRRTDDLTRANTIHQELVAEIDRTSEFRQAKQVALQSQLGTFRKFRRQLTDVYPWPAPEPGTDEGDTLKRVHSDFAALDSTLLQTGGRILPQCFRWLPWWLVGTFVVAGGAWLSFGWPRVGTAPVAPQWVASGASGALVLFFAAKLLAQHQLRSLAEPAAKRLADTRHWLELARQQADHRWQSETTRIQAEFAETNRDLRERWSRHSEAQAVAAAAAVQQSTEKAQRATATHTRLQSLRLASLKARQAIDLRQLEAQFAQARTLGSTQSQTDAAQLQADFAAQGNLLANEWQRVMTPFAKFLAAAGGAVTESASAWTSEYWNNWQPPAAYQGPAKIGTFAVEVRELVGKWPVDSRLHFPGPARVSIPLWLAYPEEGSVTLETETTGSEEARATLNNLAYRLLCGHPPGRLKVTVFDPVGLGRHFANLLHLADYQESPRDAGQRIWTEPSQMEERLVELTEQLEKVIQRYLRNEFANLAEYNAHPGSVAEPHHLLIVAGFPANFGDSSARRLLNLIRNGARCGILTLLHWDRRHPAPAGFLPDELRQAGVGLVHSGDDFTLVPKVGPGIRLHLDPPPPLELATELLHRIGRGSRGANRVQLPFELVAPASNEIWTESTAEEIRVPIGRTGASKLQYLSLGRGTRQHALISGKTGSGKSNLLHVIITTLALRCSPAELELYLVDFKKGVEFKAYATARLPHARVVAIESDREFGLSVLERLDEELRRRGELFRSLGVQDLPGYRRAGGRAPLPRCLLLVDEFQEYFVQEDRVSQNAAALLDRIVRQGRAFGIHVILASQTLGGTYALARATLGQMAVRIAFHCDEADAYLIMGEDNPAPRLLSRPGEGIYNDAAGALEANSPFQAVWLPDPIREEQLRLLRERSATSPGRQVTPVVFEGSAPANLEENPDLQRCLATPPERAPTTPVAWLGAPNAIKGPTAAAFSRSSGSNLLIVGQRTESSRSLATTALISLLAQHPPTAAHFVWVDAALPETLRNDPLESLATAVGNRLKRMTPGELPRELQKLTIELDQRQAEGNQGRPSIFLIVTGLQQCQKLKPDDGYSFSPDAGDPALSAATAFQRLYIDGPPQGLHVIACVDTYNNVNRFLGRKGLSEFEMRVLLQMSASDSSSLVDQPAAANLGLYGALYYHERQGSLETFRPYLLPEGPWLQAAAEELQRRGG